jgi:drug/metabolite transporter (DMT)-like permease
VLAAGLSFVLVCFALNSVMTRLAVSRGLLDPGLTTAVRFLAGAAALAILLVASGSLTLARPTRRSLAPAFWLGAYAVMISYGYLHIGAAAGTFVFYACVLVTLVAVGALRENSRPTLRAIAGAAVALAGVGMLAWGNVAGATPLGVLLLAGTGASWGAYSLLGRRSDRPLEVTSANFLVLGAALLPPSIALFAGAAGPLVITWEGLAIAAFMGAVTTALSYAVWYWALARISRVEAGTYQLAIPILTAAMGIGLLGEPLSERLLLAGTLVLAGMALVAASSPSQRAARSPADPIAKP